MWALSKENIFSRSASEIEYIYDLLRTELPHLEEKCIQKGIRFRALGNIQLLPKDIQNILISVEKNTNMGENMTFLLMLAYSGQDEIIR